jgi:MerR family Zn(II)-responsive transcriptional regulator of zntA
LSEIAKKHNVLASQIRYYIKQNIVVPNNRTQGGFYLFDENDERLVEKVFLLKEQGLTLSEIKERLSKGGLDDE